jgi:hypothetical protein
MSSRLLPDQKSAALLRFVMEELGNPSGWNEQTQWQKIANRLFDIEGVSGKPSTGHAIRLRYGTIMKKVRTKTDEAGQVLFFRLIIEEMGGPIKWNENKEWEAIADKLWKADGEHGKKPTGHAIRLRYGTLMKKDASGSSVEKKTTNKVAKLKGKKDKPVATSKNFDIEMKDDLEYGNDNNSYEDLDVVTPIAVRKRAQIKMERAQNEMGGNGTSDRFYEAAEYPGEGEHNGDGGMKGCDNASMN